MGRLFRFLRGRWFRSFRGRCSRRFRSRLRRLSINRRWSDLEIVDDSLHTRNRRGLLAGGVALCVVVDSTGEGDDSIGSLHRKLFGGESGILTEFGLDVAGDLGVIWLLGTAKFQRQKNCKKYVQIKRRFSFHNSTPDIGPTRGSPRICISVDARTLLCRCKSRFVPESGSSQASPKQRRLVDELVVNN